MDMFYCFVGFNRVYHFWADALFVYRGAFIDMNLFDLRAPDILLLLVTCVFTFLLGSIH